MPIIQQKTHKAAEFQMLPIIAPASGGLNIQDLEYTLNVNQSPKLTNMMYKNGVFGKRFGQRLAYDFHVEVFASIRYKNNIFIQTNGEIYEYDTKSQKMTSKYKDAKLSEEGFFFVFNKDLFFMNTHIYLKLEHGATAIKPVEPFVPQVLMNCKPDGTGGDTTPYAYNMLGTKYQVSFRGDGTTKEFKFPSEAIQKDKDGKVIPIDSTKVEVKIASTDHVEGDGSFTVDRTNYKIIFTTAPQKGTNDNVWVTISVTNPDYVGVIEKCKYWTAYGGGNNSHLFLAGNGTSRFYYSDTADASYFPETNYMEIGNSEDDITGFGLQYSRLIIFKPTELYEATYQFGVDSTDTTRYYFNTKPVNNSIGCDCPDSVQLIDSRLTWLNKTYGVCTLCSSLIEDERNVRPISRNINGGVRAKGLLDEENLDKCKSIDFDGKYILFINNHVWMWDYNLAPYTDSSTRYSLDELAENTAWFYWENIGYNGQIVTNAVALDRELFFISDAKFCKFTNACDDYGNEIYAVYETPMFDGSHFESLKTVKKVFFEARADTACNTKITYITDENSNGEEDAEPIVVTLSLWNQFHYNTFGWTTYKYAKTYTRKCSLKKICLWGCRLESGFSKNDAGKDMSISSIKFEYTIVKEIK